MFQLLYSAVNKSLARGLFGVLASGESYVITFSSCFLNEFRQGDFLLLEAGSDGICKLNDSVDFSSNFFWTFV